MLDGSSRLRIRCVTDQIVRVTATHLDEVRFIAAILAELHGEATQIETAFQTAHNIRSSGIGAGTLQRGHQQFCVEVMSPDACQARDSEPAADATGRAARELEFMLQQRHGHITAAILEPLVQGACGRTI